MASQKKPFLRLIFLLTIVANPLIKLSDTHPDSTGTMFDLIHRDHLPSCQRLTQAERIQEMLYRDMIRMQRIQNTKPRQNVGPSVIRRKTLDGEKAAVLPIESGYGARVGEYFVEIMVGTPAKNFLVIADTGSDFTWVNCNYKESRNPAPIVFDADNSTTFKTINCSSSTCQNDLHNLFSLPCPLQTHNCFYNYSYDSGSTAAQGIFGYETITFSLTDGTTSVLEKALIGCTNSSQGLENILTGASGIMALGNSNFSLPNQAYNLFGHEKVFSYCLVGFESDNTTSSKLLLGSPSHGTPKINGAMQTTKLELANTDPFYGVRIEGVSVGGDSLSIPGDAWDVSIIDSGTTFTKLVGSAYEPVMEALVQPLSVFENVSGPLDYCYAKDGFNDSVALELEVGFVGGAKLVVPGKNYLIDVETGVICLAFQSTSGYYNIIGNLMQQNNLWEFDIGNERLRFASSSCTAF